MLLHCTVGMRASGLLAVEGYPFDGLNRSQALEPGSRAHTSHVESAVKAIIRELEGK